MSSQQHSASIPFRDEWAQHEPIIRQLYEVERKTLKEVKSILEKEHGFPQRPLSIYETKLRDELGLRKKLKKGIWPIIHQHRLKRNGKPTGVYLNGSRIPEKKVWKEIRRSGARTTHQGQQNRLPEGVIVRTPSPLGQPMPPALPTHGLVEVPVNLSAQQGSTGELSFPIVQGFHLQQQEPVSLTQLGQPIPLNRTNPTNLGTYMLPDAILLMQALHTVAPEPAQSSQWTYGEWTKLFLQTLPFNMFRKSMQSITVNYSDSQRPAISEFPFPASFDIQEHHNTSGLPSSAFDAYHYFANAIYTLSNNLCGQVFRYRTVIEILDDLLMRVPRRVLLRITENNTPTIRSAWEEAVYLTGQLKLKDHFRLLMEIGARQSQWILKKGYMYLSIAALMDCPDIIESLLEAGVCPHIACTTIEASNFPPSIIAAAEAGSIQSAKVLISKCGPNLIQRIPTIDMKTKDITIFGIFIDALEEGWKPLTSTGPIKLSLGNEVHSQVLDCLLENGADVDFPYWTGPSAAVHRLYETENVPKRWRLTILERAFNYNPTLYMRLVQHSTAPERITRIGVYTAAKNGGTKGLGDYLRSVTKQNIEGKMRFLELVFAEQFFDKGFDADRATIQAMIEYGVDISLPTLKIGANALLRQLVIKARRHGITETMEFCLTILLHQGAIIDSSIMNCGVGRSGFGVLQLLFQHGANLEHVGPLALSTAAHLNNYEAVSWLLDEGVDINSDVITAEGPFSIIAISMYHKHPSKDIHTYHCGGATLEMLKYLRSHGARLQTRSGLRHTTSPNILDHLLRSASQDDQLLSKIQFILDSGVDPRHSLCSWAFNSRRYSCRGEHTASISCTFDSMELDIFEALFERGCLVGTGFTLANLILAGAQYTIVRQVLEAGADIHAYTDTTEIRNPVSSIQAAALRGDQDLISYLLQRGADIHQPANEEDGRTVLQAACDWFPPPTTDQTRKKNLIKFIVECGANVNEPPGVRFGRTALGALVSAGDIDNAVMLIGWGAEVNMCFCAKFYYMYGNRRSPLDIAAFEGRLDMVQFLLNAGGFSGYRGSTGYDGAMKTAQNAGKFAVADLIHKKITDDVSLFGRNPHLAVGQAGERIEDIEEIEDEEDSGDEEDSDGEAYDV